MTDLVFVLAYIALIVSTVVLSRSLTATVVLFFAGFSLSGVILQYLGNIGLEVTISLLRVWLAITLIAITVAAILVRKRVATHWSPSTNLVLLGLSGGVAIAFSLSRIIAPGSPTPLSSVGFFLTHIAAEDNAKWLNATAGLADGSAVNAWANVGGPLVLILTFSATVIAAISYALYGAVNEVAVSSGSLLFTELLLVVLAPLAMAPLAEKKFKNLAGKRIPWPFIFLSGMTLAAGSAVLLTYGHLTLQYTIIAFTIWIAIFLAPDRRMPWRKITTLGVAATAMVWFPLSALSVLVILALASYLLVSTFRHKGTLRATNAAWLATTVAFTYLLFSFLVSSLKFSLGFGTTTAQVKIGGGGGGITTISLPSLPLFSDPGGTEEITITMFILVLLAVLAAVWFRSGTRPLKISTALPYFPVIVLASFIAVIFMADFWAVGDGPNYASLKMAYATLFPILVVTLPYLILVIPGGTQVTAMGLLRWFGVGILILAFSFDTLYPRALMQLKPRIWSSTADSPYWYPAEVRATGDQDLSTNPIGCMYLPRGAERPSALPSGQRAYSCTRLLSGLAGVETASAPIVKLLLDEWLLNTTLWDERYADLAILPESVLKRSFILLDENSNVVGVESLGALVNRYSPNLMPDTSTAP